MLDTCGRGGVATSAETPGRRTERPEGPLLEAQLSAIWRAGLGGGWRLADGRTLRVLFPGTLGRGAGPDFRGAQLEIDGDTVVGDVELHGRERGWVEHGHQQDAGYDGVVLHVVGRNQTNRAVTRSRSGRAIPILVISTGAEPVMFEPPCTDARASLVNEALAVLGDERLEEKASRLALLSEARGPAQALYFASMEVLGGPPNRATFGRIAEQVPLSVLLERAAGAGPSRLRARIIAAELRWAASEWKLRGDGQRPAAGPARRLDAAGELIAALWSGKRAPPFPRCLSGQRPRLPRVSGIGASTRRELMTNAVLPVALLSGATRELVASVYESTGSPGTYGRLRQLERWLGGESVRPFGSGRALQGGLLLHRRYCSRGMCGRCPLSGDSL